MYADRVFKLQVVGNTDTYSLRVPKEQEMSLIYRLSNYQFSGKYHEASQSVGKLLDNNVFSEDRVP
jgi:hypothetical protein